MVGSRAALGRDLVRLTRVNWLDAEPLPAEGRAVAAKLRSAGAPTPARVFPAAEGGAELRLEAPQYGVSPGQAAVFYDGPRVLGGGWITGAQLSATA